MALAETSRECEICGCPITNRSRGTKHIICPECGRSCLGEFQRVARAPRGSTPPASPSPQQDLDALIRERIDAILGERRCADAPEGAFDQTGFDDGATVLLSDIHIPLHHVRATAAVTNFLAAMKSEGWIKRLVLAGDIFDGTNLSRHPRQSRTEGHGGDFGDEMYAGRHIIADMVDSIPGDCWIFPGNHEDRLKRKLAEGGNSGIPAAPLEGAPLLDFFEYPKKLQYYGERKLKIGRGPEGTISIIHGEKYNKHRAPGLLEENLYENTVQGHTHRPATYWFKGRFGMVNGYLHDPRRQGYMPDPSWTLGFSIFEHWDGGRKVNPYFVRIADDGSFPFAGKVYRG